MDLKKLKELAFAATPGPWTWRTETGIYNKYLENDDKPVVISDEETKHMQPENAAYIAAANPETVLKLIEEIEAFTPAWREAYARMSRRIEKLEAFVAAFDENCGIISRQLIDKLNAARRALDEETDGPADVKTS